MTRASPSTIEGKTAHAARLHDLHGFAFEVAVDDVDGGLHRALSPKPNSAYIIATDGTILFRAQWANDTEALMAALSAVVAGDGPRREKSGGVIKSTESGAGERTRTVDLLITNPLQARTPRRKKR